MQMWLRDPIRITRTRRRWTYAIGAGLWLTGVAWLVAHYFLMRHTEFGPAPSPLEFWARAAHGFFGFTALWTLGLLWGVHIVGAWNSRRHRISGITVLAVLGWLVLSGYLLYYLGSDEAISIVGLAHWVVGLLLPVPFIAHRLAPGLARAKRAQMNEEIGTTEGLI